MQLFLIFYFHISFFGHAADVAFVEIRTPDGKLVQLKKDGRYAHIAISYKGQWLHAHPYRGVEIISLNVKTKCCIFSSLKAQKCCILRLQRQDPIEASRTTKSLKLNPQL